MSAHQNIEVEILEDGAMEDIGLYARLLGALLSPVAQGSEHGLSLIKLMRLVKSDSILLALTFLQNRGLVVGEERHTGTSRQMWYKIDPSVAGIALGIKRWPARSEKS